MPVNQTSNNQASADIISRYGVQKKQKNLQSQQTQQQTQQKETAERNNPSLEDVRVTLSRQSRAKTTNRTDNTVNAETQQRTQETRNIESKQAMQAYQNTNMAAENTRPENGVTVTRQRQINRIVG